MRRLPLAAITRKQSSMKRLFTLYIAFILVSSISGLEVVMAETVTLNSKKTYYEV